jgi:hypothetical protein
VAAINDTAEQGIASRAVRILDWLVTTLKVLPDKDGRKGIDSGQEKRHVHDLARDSRAGLCIALEEGQTQAGNRPYRQIIVRGFPARVILPDMRDETIGYLGHIGVIAWQFLPQQVFLQHRAPDEQADEHWRKQEPYL